MQLGLTNVPAGVRGPGDLPGKGEWWLPDLAAALGCGRSWCIGGGGRVGSVVANCQAINGRWIVWADRSEIQRLRRLRAYELKNRRRKHRRS